MRRRLFTLLWALSLLVCVGSAVEWVRSHITKNQFWWERVSHGPAGQDLRLFYIASDWGGICISYGGSRFPQNLLTAHPNNWRPDGSDRGGRSGDSSGIYPYQGGRAGAPVAFRLVGFELTTGLRPNPKDPFLRHTLALVFPIWAITLLAAVLPLWALVRRLRRRPLPAGTRPCPRCNYDLRASTDRCPECGIAPSKLGRGG